MFGTAVVQASSGTSAAQAAFSVTEVRGATGPAGRSTAVARVRAHVIAALFPALRPGLARLDGMPRSVITRVATFLLPVDVCRLSRCGRRCRDLALDERSWEPLAGSGRASALWLRWARRVARSGWQGPPPHGDPLLAWARPAEEAPAADRRRAPAAAEVSPSAPSASARGSALVAQPRPRFPAFRFAVAATAVDERDARRRVAQETAHFEAALRDAHARSGRDRLQPPGGALWLPDGVFPRTPHDPWYRTEEDEDDLY